MVLVFSSGFIVCLSGFIGFGFAFASWVISFGLF